jgi:hypothetical protein
MAQSSKDSLLTELKDDADTDKVNYRSNVDLKKEKSLLKLYLMLLWKRVEEAEPSEYNRLLDEILASFDELSLPVGNNKYRNYLLINSNEKPWEKRSRMLYSSDEASKGKRVNKNMFASGLQGVWGVPGKK